MFNVKKANFPIIMEKQSVSAFQLAIALLGIAPINLFSN